MLFDYQCSQKYLLVCSAEDHAGLDKELLFLRELSLLGRNKSRGLLKQKLIHTFSLGRTISPFNSDKTIT